MASINAETLPESSAIELVSITRVPPASEKVPGIASFITELLYRNGVSIIDAFLGYEDIVLIVQEKFVPKAYQALSEEISEKS